MDSETMTRGNTVTWNPEGWTGPAPPSQDGGAGHDKWLGYHSLLPGAWRGYLPIFCTFFLSYFPLLFLLPCSSVLLLLLLFTSIFCYFCYSLRIITNLLPFSASYFTTIINFRYFTYFTVFTASTL